MGFLLAGILTFIPFVAQAKSLDDPGYSDIGSSAVANLPAGDASDSLPDEGRLLRNPYSHDSPTNFEPFIGPYLHVQGRQGWVSYDPFGGQVFSPQVREPDFFAQPTTDLQPESLQYRAGLKPFCPDCRLA